MLHSLAGENRLGTDRDQGVLGVPAHDLPRVSVQSSGQLWVNRTWSARRGRCAFLRLQYYFQAACNPWSASDERELKGGDITTKSCSGAVGR